MRVNLPSAISSAIATIQWSLDKPSMPMYYESLSSLRTLRKPDSIPSSLYPLIDIPTVIDDLTMDDEITSRYYITIAIALIFLGNRLSDECHNLITPLSWNDDTHFGGYSVCSTASEEVVAMASYAHSILHRREGYAQGEFGMCGYQNGNYWANAARSRGDPDILPYKEVRDVILKVSHNYGSDATEWCKMHVPKDEKEWDIIALHSLCASVSTDPNVSEQLKGFAEKAAELELRVLLKCCFERAGYDCRSCLGMDDHDNVQDGHIVDDDFALSIANKILSAHIEAFQSNQSIIVRSIFGAIKGIRNGALSAAAGLACRLLESPAVKVATSTKNKEQMIRIILPSGESPNCPLAASINKRIEGSFYGGGLIAAGDAFAFLPDEKDISSIESQTVEFSFLPCETNDPNAIFVDRFHGSRGESPTSVLQWSKGTIHISPGKT